MVSVGYRQDIVVFRVSGQEFHLYYQSVFSLVSAINVGAKRALQYAGAKASEWRGMREDQDGYTYPKVSPEYRRSRQTANVDSMNVETDGQLVVVKMGGAELKGPPDDMIHIASLLRRAARCAKNWAGDRSRYRTATASLTDAEENYKHGYA